MTLLAVDIDVELTPSELALLRTALTIFKNCHDCEEDSPRIHSETVRKILPKIKKAASQKFEELTSFERQIQFLYDEK